MLADVAISGEGDFYFRVVVRQMEYLTAAAKSGHDPCEVINETERTYCLGYRRMNLINYYYRYL